MEATFRALRRLYPEDTTALGNRGEEPFPVLISTILSQRTRDEVTEEASRRLFARYSTPEAMARASPRDLERLIRPVGFYPTKARRLIEACHHLLERHGGRVPDTLEELLRVPGVGRKTANCVLVYGFGQEAIPVDTHVHRITNRLGWVKTRSPEETEMALARLVPRRHWLPLNHLFVQFGRDICRPIGPQCPRCPIAGCPSRRA
ncbi:MAG: endonuclease III [Euryarchaeota archaeon]|nr:endonuclease III [Euryarchaeota archaeon]